MSLGVMVVTPNLSLYEELQGMHQSLASYNGGEQGFMNSFMPRFAVLFPRNGVFGHLFT